MLKNEKMYLLKVYIYFLIILQSKINLVQIDTELD